MIDYKIAFSMRKLDLPIVNMGWDIVSIIVIAKTVLYASQGYRTTHNNIHGKYSRFGYFSYKTKSNVSMGKLCQHQRYNFDVVLDDVR